MSGYVSCLGPCGACGNVFSYNPVKVPSFRFRVEKEPICQGCMKRLNEKREAAGLDPFPIDPEAYTAAPESEVF